MQTPVWCLNKRCRYEGLRLNSRARSQMVKVLPDATIRRIFPTRPSSMVGVNGRGGAGAPRGMPPSGAIAFAPFLLAKLTREFMVRTGTSCREHLLGFTCLDWLERGGGRASCKEPKRWTVGLDGRSPKRLRWPCSNFGLEIGWPCQARYSSRRVDTPVG